MPLSTEIMRIVDTLSLDDAVELLHYCADERLGLTSVKEYIELSNQPRRTIYDNIKNRTLRTEFLLGKIGIIINDMI